MEPRSELQQKIAALLAEQAALKGRVAALEARRAELERRLEQAATAAGDHQATDLAVAPHTKRPAGPV
jgi:phage shock protein A